MQRRGRIIRIRPGHLANFSGGAGYMPFIVMFSVPASAVFGVVGSLALHLRGRALLAGREDARAGLYQFVRYLRWHAAVSLVLAGAAGVALFAAGQNMVYGSKVKYAAVTAVLACGPVGAWLVSSALLAVLIAWRGPRWTNLLLAAVAHLLLLGLCIPLAMLVSAAAGAPV